MQKITPLFLLMLLPLSALANNCTHSPDSLLAHYTQSTQHHKEKPGHHRNITLIRHNSQVAITRAEHHAEPITELWTQLPNQRITMTRFFDNHKRGIEYQANEIKAPHWSQLQQLIDDRQIERMTLVTTSQDKCNKTETYSHQDAKASVTLEWLPQQRLIKRLRVTAQGVTRTLELVNHHASASEIKQQLATLDNYQTTDYADIGDNENDTFLSKMIHLGFVSHGASGFYDADGHAIGEHKH